ncbi:hypothetical protein K1719_046308 [Acacia pycnantha]|nr:hypothetical protein K1719_046308 [Acacia pycnantha]
MVNESEAADFEERVYQTKVLIVVDDVNDLDQLYSLCGNRYGKGSRIIITTRDLHLLEAFKVDLVYSMKLLSDHESLQLFSKKAFKQASPEGDFIQLSRTIVAYADGLPLALEVLGSLLAGKSLEGCKSALMKLSTLIPPQIYNTLKLSFDSLDDNKKEIFLNIVLVYIGEDTNYVIQKLDGHGCNASIGIRALVARSLVTIDKNNKLGMHNLLQLMGSQIICESSQNELPNRGHRYEVFLSFRGDTRATFTSHLYSALCNAGIIVFKDDVELSRGKHIKVELPQAIGSSTIAIIIFSREYAGSKWCLEELSTIMELHKSNDQVLLPVFYDVDPSEILLTEVGGIAGIVVLGSRDESENVKVIVENVCDILDKKELVVASTRGLPLALEVFGSYLFDREVEEWKRVLERLKKNPCNKIQKKLQISFDGLEDLEKEICLDISCFFIGKDKNDVSHILNGCEYFADIGIKTLVERSLVTFDEKNMLGMHDLLRDMGRDIIREQSPKELGKRSRLWHHEEVLAVLLERMGTEAIEGLSLKGDYKFISKDLRWLCWHGFPMNYIPSNFYQQKLVAIDLKYSKLRQVWKEPLFLEMLKILNLSHSAYLEQTPDFSKLPNLEKLILKDCPSLSTIHHSIGLLDQLLVLDLEDCVGLLNLPRNIYRLKCLKTLILSGCVRIAKLEEDIEQMESLTTLIAPTIEEVPFSINSQVFDTLSKRVSQALNLTKYSDDCILPNENYPYWLTFKGKGDSNLMTKWRRSLQHLKQQIYLAPNTNVRMSRKNIDLSCLERKADEIEQRRRRLVMGRRGSLRAQTQE